MEATGKKTENVFGPNLNLTEWLHLSHDPDKEFAPKNKNLCILVPVMKQL
jgi:hypothetical protein